MKLFLAAALVFLLSVLGMACGVIMGRRRLQGTCGGLAGLRDAQGHLLCDGCDEPSESCPRKK
ncbi:MAG: hypothetical protein KDB53_13755 [Planctomycetes bacterium]|nr:hypothetical protein [Planctomycetota bacterium]